MKRIGFYVVVPALEAATKDPAISDPVRFSLSMVRQFLVGSGQAGRPLEHEK